MADEPSLFAVDSGMTSRARAYLLVNVVFHGVTGLACLFAEERLAAPAFRFISELMPFWLWGIGFLITAAACLYALGRPNETWARVGLVLSAVSSAVWAGGFAAAVADVPPGEPVSPTGVLAWGAIAVKDLIVCRQPLRSPFEPLIKRLSGDEPRT